MKNTTVGDGEKLIRFVEKEKQQAALRFLLDEVLCYPKWLFDPEIAQYTYLLKKYSFGSSRECPNTSAEKCTGLCFLGFTVE